MATKRDEKLAKFFADSFKEVVLPSLDKLQDKVDNIGTDVVEMKEDINQIKTKLEKIDDRLDRR